MASARIVSEVIHINKTQTVPERSRLGFAAVVPEEFKFLSEMGLRLVKLGDTFAHYEGERRFIKVFHGRASYELGVQIGRWIAVDNMRCEQAFPLRDVVSLRCDPAQVGYNGTSATTAEQVSKFLQQLAAWTRDFAERLLIDGDDAFNPLSEVNAAQGEIQHDQIRAMRLRERAEIGRASCRERVSYHV